MHRIFYALFVSFTIIAHSVSAEGFPFYISDDGEIYQDTTNGTRFIRAEKIRAALRAKDSRPEDEDPQGNWGPVAQGCRISIRLNKGEFVSGEPIIATLIVRNVSEQEVVFYFRPADPSTCFVVDGPNGNRLGRLDDIPTKDARGAFLRKAHAKGVQYWLNPGIQRKFEVNLSTTFAMSKPGAYTIYALPKIMGPGAKKFTEAQSGKVIVTIKPQPDLK